MNINTTAQNLMDAMQGKPQPSAYDSQATVTRVDGDTLWVHIPGGVDETPIQRTINASEGDTVQVRISNGNAFAMGNASAPPTDDTRANEAYTEANNALTAAARAEASAATAEQAASAALDSADKAAEAAGQAIADAATAQTSAQAAQTSANAAGESASRAQAAADAAQGDIDEQKEYFWHDALGAHVLSGDDGTVRYRQDITSTGNEIFKQAAGGTETSVAVFGGDGARIGEDDISHLEMDYHSLQLIDKEGHTYFYVSDLRDANGYLETTDTFVDTIAAFGTVFTLTYPVVPDTDITVTVNGTVVTNYSVSGQTLTLHWGAIGLSTVVVEYTTDSRNAKAYTLGSRASGTIGGRSVVEGVQCVASGYASHAEGQQATASGNHSHAEGHLTTASGYASHAGGAGTIANVNYQTAIGKYNASTTGALLIGNGTAENARSNALTVDWSGNVVAAGGLTINGNVDVGAELDAINSKFNRYTSMADLYNAAISNTQVIFRGSSALWQALTTTTGNFNCYGYAVHETGTNVSYTVVSAPGGAIYCGRLSSATTINRLFMYSGTSIV